MELLGLLYLTIIDRKRTSRGARLSATHAIMLTRYSVVPKAKRQTEWQRDF